MIFKSNYVDIKNKKIYPAQIVVTKNKIDSVTKIDEAVSNYILPGFIDAHIHIESSMLIPSQFARIAVMHGTVATVSDPHEIANVLGVEGIEFMLKNSKEVNFKFNFGVPSCVPATDFETSGAVIDSLSVKQILQNEDINHLSEVMAFPSVINKNKEMMAKIEAAKEFHLPIDGHAPCVNGDDLTKYISAGITTDHEASSLEEAKEKLQKGMKILIREGSAAKNFNNLIPLIEQYHKDIMFCSDDRHPNDLLQEHINAVVKRAVQKGYDIFKVLEAACINPVSHYNLDVGLLQQGDKADFIIVRDLKEFEIINTIINGEIVYANKKSMIPIVEVDPINKFYKKKISVKELLFESSCEDIEVIQAIDHELFTKEIIYHRSNKGIFSSDISKDILKIVVINRYKPDAKPSVGFIKGFGLKKGAIASSVAHDSHNIVALGCSDEEIAKAVNILIDSKGGVCCIDKEKALNLPLEIAGLMSREDGFKVAKLYEDIDQFTKKELGTTLSAPFMTLSFMALLVIPEIKLSDKGLFDGREFHFIPLCVS